MEESIKYNHKEILHFHLLILYNSLINEILKTKHNGRIAAKGFKGDIIFILWKNCNNLKIYIRSWENYNKRYFGKNVIILYFVVDM